MRPDPPLNPDGTCAHCGRERKNAVWSKYGGNSAIEDPFCSTVCCRKWHGTFVETAPQMKQRERYEHDQAADHMAQAGPRGDGHLAGRDLPGPAGHHTP